MAAIMAVIMVAVMVAVMVIIRGKIAVGWCSLFPSPHFLLIFLHSPMTLCPFFCNSLCSSCSGFFNALIVFSIPFFFNLLVPCVSNSLHMVNYQRFSYQRFMICCNVSRQSLLSYFSSYTFSAFFS